MITASHIYKYYGNNCVLNDIGFRVPSGSIFGIMGANGAGKSTLFEIMTTLIRNFEGDLTIKGMDIRKHRKDIHRIIGYVPGHFSLYEELTVRENLSFFARIYGCTPEHIMKNHPALWESLAPFSGKLARYLSGGMQQKLAVCCALVHNPEILFLDEPTTGIDPRARHELWRELTALRSQGVTILVSTHYMEEAENMDNLLFLHQGRSLIQASPRQMMQEYDRLLVSVSGMHPYQLFKALNDRSGLPGCYLSGKNVHIPLQKDQEPDVVREFCKKAGMAHTRVNIVQPGMEDVLIRHLSHDTTRTIA